MRRSLKWAGLLYAAVVVGALAAYLVHFGDDGLEHLNTVLTVFITLLGLPAVVIAAVRHNVGASGPPPARLEDVVDQLAQGIRQQWENEERVRRLNDPYPLPLEWEAADADLVESWPLLLNLAEAKPDDLPDDASAWALSPGALAGKWADIRQVFERVPTRRLVVLGEPGAGKTMLLVRLLLTQLEHRPPGGPVPALFSLASWDPARQDLYTWMADQLARDHPALYNPAPARPPQPSPGTWARALLEGQLIVPILDGLDELPEAARPRALHAINQALRPGRPLVLSSRTAEYRSALTPPAGTPMLLNGAAGIRLDPLNAAQAAAYLLRDAGGTHIAAAARWGRVTASLGTGTPAAQALSTPLGLFLARSIYNPRPGDEHPAGLAHPDELLDQTRFPTRRDVDAHLFRIFIPAAYSPHHRHPSPWTGKQAEHTLTFLARHLEHTLHGTPDLAWWQLHKALPTLALALIPGLPLGLLFGLTFGLLADPTVGVLAGMQYGLLGIVLLIFDPEPSPTEGIRWSWKGRFWVRALTPAAVLGLGFGLFAYPSVGHFSLVGGLLGIVAGGLLSGLTSLQPDLNKAVGPGAVLAQDRRTFWTITLATGIVSCLIIAFLTRLSGARFTEALILGLPFGALIGIGFAQFGRAKSVWLAFLSARIELAVLGRVPWRFMAFLADAHKCRGVLRQVGAVYQFRHLDLQRHLAGPPPRRHTLNPPRWPPKTPGGGTS
ncbi:NACHT domain-containing protein [Streptomyces sp. NPDC048258]|uniref:NACHT domain-containing protein n=1 Tax=Streptomyces sp. NPDC048258 TaxID=3365527 RepID=UPI003723F7A1